MFAEYEEENMRPTSVYFKTLWKTLINTLPYIFIPDEQFQATHPTKMEYYKQ